MVLVILSTYVLWILLMLFFYAFMKAHGIHAGGDLNPKLKKNICDIFSYNGDKFQEVPTKTNRKHAYARIANFEDQPFVVGGSDSGNKITERLNSLGVWEQDQNWPFSNRIYNYATISRNKDRYNDYENYVLIILVCK